MSIVTLIQVSKASQNPYIFYGIVVNFHNCEKSGHTNHGRATAQCSAPSMLSVLLSHLTMPLTKRWWTTEPVTNSMYQCTKQCAIQTMFATHKNHSLFNSRLNLIDIETDKNPNSYKNRRFNYYSRFSIFYIYQKTK